jgi:hypothetical protein
LSLSSQTGDDFIEQLQPLLIVAGRRKSVASMDGCFYLRDLLCILHGREARLGSGPLIMAFRQQNYLIQLAFDRLEARQIQT